MKTESGSGQLIYLVGSSGAGKDTLLNTLRFDSDSSSSQITNLIIMHRYITRPAHVGNENHISLDHEEFMNRREKGEFSLDWQAHETFYGIGKELDEWLGNGVNVLVNGSRKYFPNALEKYPDIRLVWLTVDSEVLLQRLIQRDRESLTDIQQRIERNKALEKLKPSDCFTLDNSGDIESTTKQLHAILNGF